jgi:uncharacterized membrane protein
VTNSTATASGAAPTWAERILGGAAYFSLCLPPFWLTPLLFYRWKRRTSRFVALHAVQSVLLAFALLFLYPGLAVVWTLLSGLAKTKAELDILGWIVIAAALGPLLWSYVGMPFVPLRGSPAALPILARWAARILDSPPGEGGVAAGKSTVPAYTAQRPEDRLLAGAAYFSLFCLCPFPFGPLVVYFWKRRTSRFVAFHAIQAFLLHLLLIPLVLVLFFGGIVGGGVIGELGRAWRDVGGAVFLGGGLAAFASPSVILWRGFAAMLGPPDALPLLGRLARWISRTKPRV